MNSCIGCKYLWAAGTEYSDLTWEETEVRCAKALNPNLPVREPYDWIMDEANDNLPATQNSRCASFSPGPYITVSPGGYWDGEPIDDEQRAAIGETCEYQRED